jgi:uncharacterized protein YoxC
MNRPGAPIETKRLTVGDKILEQAAFLADRAQRMAQDVNVTLAPISSMKEEEKDLGASCEETWPPMYQELRLHFQRIERAIDQMQDALNRAEL